MSGGGMSRADKVARALLRRGAAIAARRVERRADRLADLYAEVLPGTSAERGPRGVVLRGRRLMARMLRDPVARWPGGWLS